MPMRRFLRSSTMLSSVVGATFVAMAAANAADSPVVKAPAPVPLALPAVDGINYRASLFGGSLWERSLGGGDATIAMPLAPNYGFQADGVVSSWGGRFYGELHGHWFWRDPAVGMLGLYAAYTHLSRFGDVHAAYLGAEFARYYGPWELKGLVGVETGNSASALTSPTILTTYDIDTRFFDRIDLSYYFTENMKLGIGHRYLSGKNALALRGEWAAPLGGGRMASIFVEGRAGEDNFKSIWAGLRMYFGNKDKSLIRRHREDILSDTVIGFDRETRLNQRCPPGEIFIPGYGCGFDID
jgi:hypothetical protein